MTEYCPYHVGCPFYQNWVEQTNDKRVDIIIGEFGAYSKYKCLTLMALDDSETGIEIGEDLRNKLSDSKKIGCSHITLLNLSNKIYRSLNRLRF